MSREIRFKCWDKNLKKFIPTNFLRDTSFSDPTYEFCQFTGLKDKNEKEIYEGDILNGQVPDSLGWVKWESGFVTYKNERAMYVFDYGYDYNFLMRIENISIIGNIFENPELLK